MEKCFEDYVDHLVEFAKKKGYRVSKRGVRNLLRSHFREMYLRIGSKQEIYIHDFLLLIIRKDLFFKRHYVPYDAYYDRMLKEVDVSTEPVYSLADFSEPGEEQEEE